MTGVLNIDKPQGITSHDVVNRLRRLTGIRRIGHAGTLDPLATGILVVCVGRATRLVEYVQGRPKTYEATVRLGQTTDSYDAEGEIVAERPLQHTLADINLALAAFRGTIEQYAPIYSAIKRNGQPLYKLARQGVAVQRPLREVTIYSLDVISYEAPNLQLHITCSTGTYIRSLAHDLGEALGCGGHITALRRTVIGDFTLTTAVRLDDLDPQNVAAHILPLDTAVAHLPRLDLNEADVGQLLMGQRPLRRADHRPEPLVRAYDSAGNFIGIITMHENVWKPHKMFPSIPDS